MYALLIFVASNVLLPRDFAERAKKHAFSNTKKLFGNIPPRDDLIKMINLFLMVPKSKLRKTN